MTKPTAEQRLTKSRMWVFNNSEWCWLAGVMSIGKCQVVDSPPPGCPPTAWTDGMNTYYARSFVDGLNDSGEVTGLLLHEYLHVALQQLTTWQNLFKDNARLANMAIDLVVNDMIVEFTQRNNTPRSDLALPPEALHNVKYRGWDARRVYDDLKAKVGQGGGQAESLDGHQWDEAKALSQETQGEIQEAVRQGLAASRMMHKDAADRFAKMTEVKTDWREALRTWLTEIILGTGDNATWRRLNRKAMSQNRVRPTYYDERMGPLIIAIDTSGSIGGPDLAEFLGNVRNILHTSSPRQVHLWYWDTAVRRKEIYEPSDFAALGELTKPAGGGGTDLGCVREELSRMDEDPSGIIVLTDGYLGGQWHEWPVPFLAGISTSAHCPLPHIRIQ